MKIEIELRCASYRFAKATKKDIKQYVNAAGRAILGRPLAGDFVLMLSIKSILDSIYDQLEEEDVIDG